MADALLIQAPLWQLPLLVLIPPAVVILMALWMRRVSVKKNIPPEERDWSVPSLTRETGASLLHRWDVRCKIATILIYSFIISSLGHLRPALAAIGISIVVLGIARSSFSRVMLRLSAITGFIGMFLVIMPFTAPIHPGDHVIVFGGWKWLSFNLRGLSIAGTIAAKAAAIALLMEPLLSTAPLPVTLHGLTRLGVPEMVGQMVLLSHRYIHVFGHEARRMAAGMKVRGFRKRTDIETLRAVANFLGMLFVRSFERTERVFDAMRARGYTGRFPEPTQLRLHPKDLAAAAAWLTVGIALVLWDRIFY